MMMKTYLIAYDLTRTRPVEDYPQLLKTIRSLGTWWHQLESAWIIKADASANSILEKLSPHLDPADELLVVELSGSGAWTGFDANGASWLKANLTKRMPVATSDRRIED